MLVRRRCHPPIGGQEIRGAAEVTLVRLQAVLQVRLILAATLIENLVTGDDPALDLVESQFAAELHRLASLEPGDDLGMWLKEREQLLRGRHCFPIEDPAGRLLDALNQKG